MRLKSFTVRMFRNVIDSGGVRVDPNVTCLVGKNESGKTAMLNALYRLNPVAPDATFDASKQYPRWRLSRDRKDGIVDASRPITAIFEIEPDDAAAVAAVFGEGVLTSSELVIAASYAGATEVEVVADAAVATRNVYEALGTPKALQRALGEGALLGSLPAALKKLDENDEWPTDEAAQLAKEVSI